MARRHLSLPTMLIQQLTAARRAKALSQAQLGNLVGLPQAHISGIETGRVIPRYDTLLEIVRVLGHDLVLVPREWVPVVEALVRGGDEEAEERPLYQPDGEDEDDQEEPSSHEG